MASVGALRWIEGETGTITGIPLPDGAAELSLSSPLTLASHGSRSSPPPERVRVCHDEQWLRDCFAARGLPLDDDDSRLARAGAAAVAVRGVVTAGGWRLLRLRFSEDEADEDWFPEDAVQDAERPLRDGEIAARCAAEVEETRARLACEDTEAASRREVAVFCPSAAGFIAELQSMLQRLGRRAAHLPGDDGECVHAMVAAAAVDACHAAAADQLGALRAFADELCRGGSPAAAPAQRERNVRGRAVLRLGPVPPEDAASGDLEGALDDEVLPVVVRAIPSAGNLGARGLCTGMRLLAADGQRLGSAEAAAEAIRQGSAVDVVGQWEAEVEAAEVELAPGPAGPVLAASLGPALPRGARLLRVDGSDASSVDAAYALLRGRHRVLLRVSDPGLPEPDCVCWTAATAPWRGSAVELVPAWAEWVAETFTAAVLSMHFPHAALPSRVHPDEALLWLPDAPEEEVAEAAATASAAVAQFFSRPEAALDEGCLAECFSELCGGVLPLADVWAAGQPSPATHLPCIPTTWHPNGFEIEGAPVHVERPCEALCRLLPCLTGARQPPPDAVQLLGNSPAATALLRGPALAGGGPRVSALASALTEHAAARLRAGLGAHLRARCGSLWCADAHLASGVHLARVRWVAALFDRAVRHCAAAEAAAAAEHAGDSEHHPTTACEAE
eukprot:TRINITY_DN29307_c0_g1_i1.p1 TRINITY_DN29307_c0_g1~~TRINITY_DN29307_c0_g1_i1.p1  ORF type:complete len:707 (+),score=102.63 TRINITY_DN29307_c0_g1_i1:96-2123(+)